MLDAPRHLPGRWRPVHVPGRQRPVRRRVVRSRTSRTRSRSGAGARRGRSRCRPASATTARPASRAERGGTGTAAPNSVVGVGTSAAGLRPVGALQAHARELTIPRVRVHLRGRSRDDELIGDQPSLQTKWGAAGYEIDRFEHELGSPATTLCSPRRSGSATPTSRWSTTSSGTSPGREGKHPDDPQVARRAAPVRRGPT